MSVNKALIKGDIRKVHKLMSRGNIWEGPKNYYNDKFLTSNSFKFPNSPHKLAHLLLTVLDLGLIDLNEGACDINWIWYITLDKPVKPFMESDLIEFIHCYDAYILANNRYLHDCEMATPQIKIYIDKPSSLYCFDVEQHNQQYDMIAYRHLFDKTNAIKLLMRLNICENKPYSC